MQIVFADTVLSKHILTIHIYIYIYILIYMNIQYVYPKAICKIQQ